MYLINTQNQVKVDNTKHENTKITICIKSMIF